MSTFSCFVVDCNDAFNSATTYINHLLRHHRVPRDYRFPCTFKSCPSVFSKFCSFKRHVLHHENDADISHHANTETSVRSDFQSDVAEHDREECNEYNIEYHTDAVMDALPAIDKACINFTLDLHRRSNLTRADVRNIQDNTQHLYAVLADQIQLLPLQNDGDTQFKLGVLLDKMINMFNFINTDFKLFKLLEKRDIFKLPTIITVEKSKIKTLTLRPEDNIEINNDKHYIALLDVEFQLRKFFESGDVFEKTLEYIKTLENSDRIKNFINGNIWTNIKQKYPNETVLPINLYADEYEINDVLSSHNKKDVICGLYYSCLTIPDEYRSRLCNIFVAGAIKKVAISEIGINELISEVIDRFKQLEEVGVRISVDGKNYFIRFALILCQGDNLGVHSLLMLSGGFNANFYCRFCRRAKNLLQKDTIEHVEWLRNEENYLEDIAINNQKETGIKGESEFNKLPSFHVTQNKSVDPMHDFFSTGVCKYGLTHALNHFIYHKKYFTLQQVNTRRRAISKVSLNHALARMPDIDEFFDSNSKSKSIRLRTTASEMRAFCYHFTFIVGPLVPHRDPVWEYVKVLVNLVELSLLPSLSDTDITKLKELVCCHHEMYQELFSESLKPKHHFLVHYGTVIEECGPVVKQMCFRFEAKHKQFKQYAHAVTSRRNICYTLCVKASLQYSYDLLNELFFKRANETKFTETDLRERSYFNKLVGPCMITFEQVVLSTLKAKVNGILYKNGSFVTLTNLKVTELIEIVEIIQSDTTSYIVGQLWQCGEFNEHLLAYEAQACTQLFQIHKLTDFDGPPFMIYNIDNKMYFRKRFDYIDDDNDM